MHEVGFFLFSNFFLFLHILIFYLSLVLVFMVIWKDKFRLIFWVTEVDVLIGIAQKTMPAEVDWKKIPHGNDSVVIRDCELRVVLLAQELALIQIILNYYPDGGLTKLNETWDASIDQRKHALKSWNRMKLLQCDVISGHPWGTSRVRSHRHRCRQACWHA